LLLDSSETLLEGADVDSPTTGRASRSIKLLAEVDANSFARKWAMKSTAMKIE